MTRDYQDVKVLRAEACSRYGTPEERARIAQSVLENTKSTEAQERLGVLWSALGWEAEEEPAAR